MSIAAHCQCGAKFAAPDHLAGKSVACPTCKQPLKIPAQKTADKAASPKQAAAKKAAPQKQPAAKQPATKKPAAQKQSAQKPATQSANGKIPVKCQCGASFAAPPKLAGKRVACPTCKQPVAIPAAKKQAPAAASSPAKQTASAPAAGGGLDDLLDELGVEGKKVGENYCPECSAPFPVDALICVQCGFNRKSGRKLVTKKVKAAPKKVVDLTAPKGGFKTSSGGGGSSNSEAWVKPVLIGIGVITLLCMIASLIFPFAAILIVVLGSLISTVGGFWILAIAFQDDVVQGLLVWLVPFYFFIYVAQNYQETKLAFQAWLLGILMIFGGFAFMIIGIGIITAIFGGSS
jgi:uncharacterized protein YbaR (Trm112 family)